METKTATTQESPKAGKGGETTANATRTAGTSGQPDLSTPGSVQSLLASEFAQTAPAEEPATAAPGEEVQPEAAGEETTSSEETSESENTPASEEGAESPEEQPTAGELPAEVLEQVQAWEAAGGALPPALQGIVDGRIKRELGKTKELESKLTAAEAEANRLKTELAAKGEPAPAAVDPEGNFPAKLAAARKFVKDARPFVGGYATEEQRTRIEKFMTSQGLDENSFRQYLDEVSDWVTNDAPREQQKLEQFRADEQKAEPLIGARFGALEKKDSVEAGYAAEVRKLMPELKSRTPAHKLAVAAFVLGKVAAEHLLAASKEGDVVETLKSVLAKHVPLPSANGKPKPATLPGKAPVRTPTGSPVNGARPATNGKQAQLDQQSEKLRQEPTKENVHEALIMALR